MGFDTNVFAKSYWHLISVILHKANMPIAKPNAG
jgi:hypothetical protein